MKRLPPSLQEKQRYLHFRIHSREKVDLGDVVDAIWEAGLDYLGSKSLSEADFWIMGNRFDESKQEGILRVNRSSEDDFRAALTTLNSISGEKAFLEVLNISGTIKSLEN